MPYGSGSPPVITSEGTLNEHARDRKNDDSLQCLPGARYPGCGPGDVEKRLQLHAMRVIGNPEVLVSRAALLQGTHPFHAATVLPKVNVVVAGEQRECEGVEYTADANTAGERKGMILIGHWVSEDQRHASLRGLAKDVHL